MHRTSTDEMRFEPTVLGAMRRYWAMVLGVTILGGAAAAGYGLGYPPDYEATAKVTVRQPLLLASQPSDQYLDSQVLVLQSPEVAERAALLANNERGVSGLSPEDFAGDRAALTILPPEGTTPGAYGSNTIRVSFAWPDAATAQAGANAVLRAYGEHRSSSIQAEGVAATAGIERAIDDARTEGQQNVLLNRRARVLVEQQLDLSRSATIVWAAEPLRRVDGGLARIVLTGLFVGLLAGATLAYLRQRRRRSFTDPAEPALVYGAPLIHQVTGPARADEPLVMASAPHSSGAEAFRFAADFVERLRTSTEPSLVVCALSPLRNPDRSAALANLALALAESGRQVLTVDADPTTGQLTRLLLPARPLANGLRQVMAGEAAAHRSIVRSPLSDNVSVLPLGPPVHQALTGSGHARSVGDLLDLLRDRHEIVLVDAMLGLADGLRVVRASDAVIIVVGEDDPVPAHQEAADLLAQVDAHVAGYLYLRTRGRLHQERLVEGVPGRISAPPDRYDQRAARSPQPEPPASAPTNAHELSRSAPPPPR